MKFAPYSYSRLSTHEQCARKFKYSYIDKIPVGYVDRTALLKGGAVHSILENYPDKSTHKLAPKYQYIADKFISTELAEKYLSVDSNREVHFGLNKDLEPTEYRDKNAIFRGKIDHVCIIDGVLYLIDWKTGKLKDIRWQDFRQLLFYAIYFFKKYSKINKIKISYVYVEHESENDILLERQYLDKYTKELTDMIDAAENDEEFRKSESKLCEWCDFKDHCSEDINK